MATCMSYRAGYKYQIQRQYEVVIDLKPETAVDTEYIDLDTEGKLVLKGGYAWDGPSGPTFDTRNFMRASLVHDALYQLLREGVLADDREQAERYREQADRILRQMCREDGMSAIRAWWVFHALRMFGNPAADPANKKPIVQVPDGCEP